MPTVAINHERHAGHVVGSGQCVAFVRDVTGLPPTSHWRRGVLARGADLVPGTALATFNGAGRYPNTTSGDSHACIFLEEAEDGIWVLDQWIGHPVSERLIQARAGGGKAVDDAGRYHVIELAEDD